MADRKSRSTAKAAHATTVAAYLASLTPEKRVVIEEARAFVHRHIPKGYAEFMNWGVINWGIPLEEFPNTYNGQPLCYVGLGAKKSYNSLYLMGAYDSSNGKYTTPFSEKLPGIEPSMVPRRIGSLRWVMAVTRMVGLGERSPAR